MSKCYVIKSVYGKDIRIIGGTHDECAKYLTNKFTPEQWDNAKGLYDIMYDSGRLASYVLKW